ncbi:MAG: hypothetical protein H7268_02710, partial [Sandarakinorhabdus sp.]|nr:hypothetical protein [Sandarakinorhabdus sp.]
MTTGDPVPGADDAALAAARARSAPAVAQPANRWVLPVGIAAVLALGGLTFAAVRKPEPVADATPISETVRPPTASTDLPPPPV